MIYHHSGHGYHRLNHKRLPRFRFFQLKWKPTHFTHLFYELQPVCVNCGEMVEGKWIKIIRKKTDDVTYGWTRPNVIFFSRCITAQGT